MECHAEVLCHLELVFPGMWYAQRLIPTQPQRLSGTTAQYVGSTGRGHGRSLPEGKVLVPLVMRQGNVLVTKLDSVLALTKDEDLALKQDSGWALKHDTVLGDSKRRKRVLFVFMYGRAMCWF